MHRLLCTALLLVSAVVRADEPPPVIMIDNGPVLTLPLPLPRATGLPILEDPEDRAAPNLTGLRTQVQKLREQREALAKDRNGAAQFLEDAGSLEVQDSAKLRLKLGGLLTQLGLRKDHLSVPSRAEPTPAKKDLDPSPAPKVSPKQPVEVIKEDSVPFSKTLDPMALASALFRAGNYQGAAQAYQMLPLDGMNADERAPVQYLIATCLRKLGKNEDAAVLYREVANVKGDENLASAAQWQLNTQRWQREMNDQLKNILDRRKALEKMP
jgi:tetratricopeptide (TPR) repeat protein